jgi:hypothetical protein
MTCRAAAVATALACVAAARILFLLNRDGGFQADSRLPYFFTTWPVGLSGLSVVAIARGWRPTFVSAFVGGYCAFVVLGLFSIGPYFIPGAWLLVIAGLFYVAASGDPWDAALAFPAFPFGASVLAGSMLGAGSIQARLRGTTEAGREQLDAVVLAVFIGSSAVLLAMVLARFLVRRKRRA